MITLLVDQGRTWIFWLIHFFTSCLNNLMSLQFRISRGSWFRSAELWQKKPLRPIDKCDWIDSISYWRVFGLTELCSTISFLAKLPGWQKFIAFLAVTSVIKAVNCWTDRSPVISRSVAVGVLNGRPETSLRTRARYKPWNGYHWRQMSFKCYQSHDFSC